MVVSIHAVCHCLNGMDMVGTGGVITITTDTMTVPHMSTAADHTVSPRIAVTPNPTHMRISPIANMISKTVIIVPFVGSIGL